MRGEQGVEVAWGRFDIESCTALNGNQRGSERSAARAHAGRHAGLDRRRSLIRPDTSDPLTGTGPAAMPRNTRSWPRGVVGQDATSERRNGAVVHADCTYRDVHFGVPSRPSGGSDKIPPCARAQVAGPLPSPVSK